MTAISRFASAALCLLLGGCAPAVYNEALGPSELSQGRVMDAAEAVARWGVDRDWWKGYRDPELNRLMDEALAANRDLAAAAIRVNRALYQARRIGADMVPVFSGGADAGRSKNLDSGDSADPLYGAELGIGYEVDLWGRLRNERSAAAWLAEASVQDLESTRLSLVAAVADTLFLWRYTREARELTRQNITHFERILHIAEQRHRQGKADGLEELNARQALLAAQNSLLTLDDELTSHERTLRDLLNRGPEKPLDLAEISLLDTLSAGPDLSVPLAALSLRPDVRAAEYRLQSAFRDKEAAQTLLYPSVTVGSRLSFSSDGADTLFDVPLLAGTVKVNLPFLQGNKLRWEVKISEADFEAARLTLEKTLTAALNEVDTLYAGYRSLKAQLANHALKLATDTEATRYRESRWKNGAGELSDWLHALNTQTASRLALLKGHYELLRQENALYRALGGRRSAVK